MHVLLDVAFLFFFLTIRLPPNSTLFPYTTLFRSGGNAMPFSLPLPSALTAWKVRIFDNELLETPHASIVKGDRKSTRLNSSHTVISYAVFCLKKKKGMDRQDHPRLGASSIRLQAP